MSSSAFALTPKQVANGYYGCMKFLKLPAAKQRLVAQKTPYSLSKLIWACHVQARKGLAEMQRNEREYQREMRGGSSGGGYEAPAPSDPYGGSGGGGFSGGTTICNGGVCSGPRGTTICNGGVCSGPDGTTICNGGVCSGPRGTTICTGGVCNGPDGTVICNGGVCN